jgi:O-antigen/teichoic acid export membrane protein
LAASWLKIGISWQPDAQLAFQIAAMGVIPTTLTSGLRGALEGFGRFAASNLMRLFFGLCMFVLPALSIIFHGNSIAYIASYLVGARLVVVLVGFFQLRAHLIFAVSWAEVARVRSLLSYGFWVTVSGIVGPLMIYGDRFFVSAMVGADQLPFYAIPQEGLQRLLIIPGALCAALLPRFASMHGRALVSFLNISYKRLALGMFFVCLVAALLAGPILSWWLSPDFAERATPIVWVLAIGIWFNSLAQLPYTVIHSLGQPKLTAIFHLVELVFYFFSLYFLAKYFGLLGAAVAWVARVVLDFGLLFLASNRLLGKDRNNARS